VTRVPERVSFLSATGPTLAGLVDLPEDEVRGWGVFAHGFTLGKGSPAASRIFKQLASEGIGMLRFDNLGLGDSEGDWGDGSFSVKVADTARAVEFMNTSGREVRLLVGHSFGGSAVLAAAHECGTVAGVVSVAAPHKPSHVEHNYDALVDRIEADGEAPFLVGGKALKLKRHSQADVFALHANNQLTTGNAACTADPLIPSSTRESCIGSYRMLKRCNPAADTSSCSPRRTDWGRRSGLSRRDQVCLLDTGVHQWLLRPTESRLHDDRNRPAITAGPPWT
jgi:alpha/beta superfamily hydrolase